MRVPLKIIYADGRELDVVAGPGQLVKLERQCGVTFADLPQDENGNLTGLKLEWVFFLGWAAARRTEPETNEDFDAWLDEIDVVEPVTEGIPPTSPPQIPPTTVSPDSLPVSA